MGSTLASNGSAAEPSTQLAIPQQVWEEAGRQSRGKGDSLTLELTQRVSGQIQGPIISHLTIAQAAVPRIPPGGNAEVVTAGEQYIGAAMPMFAPDGKRLVFNDNAFDRPTAACASMPLAAARLARIRARNAMNTVPAAPSINGICAWVELL